VKTDEFYATYLGLRAEPVSTFLGDSPSSWALPITSMNEDVLLIQLGVSRGERDRIEGILRRHPSSTVTLSEEQQISRAVIRLAADPPLQVGRMQRRTAGWLVRPFPLGQPCEDRTKDRTVPFGARYHLALRSARLVFAESWMCSPMAQGFDFRAKI
jgi:hypothetical protein